MSCGREAEIREISGSVERGHVLETRGRNQTSQNVWLDVSEQYRSGVTSCKLITADQAHASLPAELAAVSFAVELEDSAS